MSHSLKVFSFVYVSLAPKIDTPSSSGRSFYVRGEHVSKARAVVREELARTFSYASIWNAACKI